MVGISAMMTLSLRTDIYSTCTWGWEIRIGCCGMPGSRPPIWGTVTNGWFGIWVGIATDGIIAPRPSPTTYAAQHWSSSRMLVSKKFIKTHVCCTCYVCQRHHKVCCFRCCRMKPLTPGTTNALLLSTKFCAKTKETPVYQLLRAHLRIFYFALYKCTLYYYYCYWIDE